VTNFEKNILYLDIVALWKVSKAGNSKGTCNRMLSYNVIAVSVFLAFAEHYENVQ
jgi:hypothetical protein